MISNATIGHLHIVDVDGTTYDIGNKQAKKSKIGEPVVKLYVLNDRFWLRLALFSDVVSDHATLTLILFRPTPQMPRKKRLETSF
jgi:hypothetical protein